MPEFPSLAPQTVIVKSPQVGGLEIVGGGLGVQI